MKKLVFATTILVVSGIYWTANNPIQENWRPLLAFAVFYFYGPLQYLIKRYGASQGSRARKLVYQYFFMATISAVGALVFGYQTDWRLTVVFVMGILNAISCYCHWRSMAISVSKSAMMAGADDVVAMSLGYWALNEASVVTPLTLAGIGLSLASGVIFAINQGMKQSPEKQEVEQKTFLLWVLGYSVTWGALAYVMRAFSLGGIPCFTFVSTLYAGSLAGALLVRHKLVDQSEVGDPLTDEQKHGIRLLGLCVWDSMLLLYLMRASAAPLIISQPALMVGEFTIPVLVGFVFFGEHKEQTFAEKSLILLGTVGMCIVYLTFN